MNIDKLIAELLTAKADGATEVLISEGIIPKEIDELVPAVNKTCVILSNDEWIVRQVNRERI